MKNKKLIIISTTLMALLFFAFYTYPWVISAGGVGNIELYDFNVSREVLSKQIDSLILNDKSVGVPSKQIYNLDGTGYEDDSKYIYFINNENDTLVYRFKYSATSTAKKTVLALTHFGFYGESPLKTSQDIFFFQRKDKAKGFEEILSKLQTPAA